jgi:tellurite resistance protein
MLKLSELPACDDATFKRGVVLAVQQQSADAIAPSVGPRSQSGKLPSMEKLQLGAAQLASDTSEGAAEARYFKAMLEIAYLAAAADGLGEGEARAISELIQTTTSNAVGADALDKLFGEFAAQLEADGLEARLDAVADSFDDFMACDEALGFASLVAISDGKLGGEEASVLLAVGMRFEFTLDEVQAILDTVTVTLQMALERAKSDG